MRSKSHPSAAPPPVILSPLPFALSGLPPAAARSYGPGAADAAVSDQLVGMIRVEAQATSLFISPEGVYPTGLVISPDGKKLYIANRGYLAGSRPPALNHTVSVIDTATQRVERTIDVHGAPWALAASPDGRR